MSKTLLKPTAMAWGLWALVSFFYFFQYVIRVSPSVMISDIMQKFCVTTCEFGDFSGAYYLGYALAHIPLGLLLDRYPLKWIISGTIFLSVFGLIPLIFTDVWYFSVLGRFLIGVGSSGAILSVFKVIRVYFPESWFSRLLGFSVTIGLLGAIYGSAPIHHLSQNHGWGHILTLIIAVGMVLAVLVALIIPKGQGSTAQNNGTSLLNDLKDVLKNRSVILTALFAAFMVGPLEGFADVWAVPFLEITYGFDKTIATSLPSLIFIGMCVGSPVLAALAEKYQAYNGIIRWSSVLMALIFAIILALKPSIWVVSILFFLIGMLCAYQVLALTLNGKNADEKHSGFVTALTNMIIMSFGSLYHTLIGRVIAFNWDGMVVDQVPIYSAKAYSYGVMVIPFGLMIAFVGFLSLKQRQDS